MRKKTDEAAAQFSGETTGVGPKPREPYEILKAQRNLAVTAVDNPTITSDAEREVALKTVLAMLGIDKRTVLPRAAQRKVQYNGGCGKFAGTVAGYHKHITAYQTPCAECTEANQADRDQKWASRGIPLDGGEVVTSSGDRIPT